MKRKLKIALLSGCAISLVGCSFNPFTFNNHTTGSAIGAGAGAVAGGGIISMLGGSKTLITLGAIGGGMLGYYVTTLRYDAGGIIYAGGQVYTVGDMVGINIPSDDLFEYNTAEFTSHATPILDSAAVVLQRYPNNNILISGNTSGFSRTRWERRLSEERARKVSAYLWKAGINHFKEPGTDLRKLNYVGYGNYFPIANSITNEGIRQNSRIQITSYPSSRDLHLDSRHQAVFNIGALDSPATDDSPNECGSLNDGSFKPGCFKPD